MGQGKFVVLEGIDGSGKDTQLKLLTAKLQKRGIEFRTISFPRHGDPAAYFVDKYLQPDYPYGTPEKVGAYRASIFFALDRYDASFQVKEWLEQGILVIADRYIISNIGHQGGKIADLKEREKYVDWLYDLEYRLFGIPKPDLNILFWLPPEIAQKRIEGKQQRLYLGSKQKDAHEADLKHLQASQEAFLWAAQKYPEEFRIIKCAEEQHGLTPEETHQGVLAIFREIEILK